MFICKTKTLNFLVHLIIAYLCGASLATEGQANIRDKEKQVLNHILGNEKYDSHIRPSGFNGTDGPVIVRANMFVRMITKVDDANMEYSVQLTFRQEWTDERLKYENIDDLNYLYLTQTNRIWTPDLFFTNEKESHLHNINVPNLYVRIFPNGKILYSMRISLTLSCSMNFKLYPFDRQDCPMKIAPYGSTTDDVVLLWKEGDAVQVTKFSVLQKFRLKNISSDYCSTYSKTPEYSCLKTNFLFERNLLHYLYQIYIPCCVLVFASWISFWLHQEEVTARVLLGVATLLTMSIQVSHINASLPATSYIKAIDIWTSVCLTFMFGALLEFALVNSALSSDMKRKCEETDANAVHNLIYNETNKTLKTWTTRCRFSLSKLSRSQKIDIISRITFPLVFAIFNLAYWSIYLTIPNDFP